METNQNHQKKKVESLLSQVISTTGQSKASMLCPNSNEIQTRPSLVIKNIKQELKTKSYQRQ